MSETATAWKTWRVYIQLGTEDAPRAWEARRYLGSFRARTSEEAERKGRKRAKLRGLSGLIEVGEPMQQNEGEVRSG